MPPSPQNNEDQLGADEVIGTLRRIIRGVDLRSRQIFAQCGLTVPQLLVLKRLDLQAGVTVTALTRMVHLSQATVTGILDRLEDNSLIRRSRSSRDRRCTEVFLTSQGQQALATAPQLLQESFRRRVAELQDWERSLILSSLQRVVSMLEAGDVDAAPVLSVGPLDAVPLDAGPSAPSSADPRPPTSRPPQASAALADCPSAEGG